MSTHRDPVKAPAPHWDKPQGQSENVTHQEHWSDQGATYQGILPSTAARIPGKRPNPTKADIYYLQGFSQPISAKNTSQLLLFV